MKNNTLDKSKNIAPQKLKNQCRSAEAALKQTFSAVFASPHRPLDRALATYFRNNKQLGSRDRQFISESIFAVFRHWGAVRRLLNKDTCERIIHGETGYSGNELGVILSEALKLAGLDFQAASFWEKSQERGQSSSQEEEEFWPAFVAEECAYNFDLEAMKNVINRRPPMWIRVQQLDKLEALLTFFRNQEVRYNVHPLLSNAVALYDLRANLHTLDAFRDGVFEVQDLASQAIGLVAGPQKGERWLDCCAGAGGKTLQLASLMEQKGTVVATDVRAYKLDDLKLRARRAGFPNISCKEWDGKALKEKQQGKFDGVLVDAPCSCSGVWRRNPDGRWTALQEEIAPLADLQLSILESVCAGVKIGGVLVYATCSIFEKENRGVVTRFLERHPEFQLLPFANPLTGQEVPEGMMQADMARHDCDSMFAAKMRRK